MTSRTPNDRLREANRSDTWRPPAPFVVEFAKKVYYPLEKESIVHGKLQSVRIHVRREYFQATPATVRAIFDTFPGEMWYPALPYQIHTNTAEHQLHRIKERIKAKIKARIETYLSQIAPTPALTPKNTNTADGVSFTPSIFSTCDRCGYVAQDSTQMKRHVYLIPACIPTTPAQCDISQQAVRDKYFSKYFYSPPWAEFSCDSFAMREDDVYPT